MHPDEPIFVADNEPVYEYATWRATGPDLRSPLEEERGLDLTDWLDRCAKVGYKPMRRRIIVVEDWEFVERGGNA